MLVYKSTVVENVLLSENLAYDNCLSVENLWS